MALSNLSEKGYYEWFVNSVPKLTRYNLNMKITFYIHGITKSLNKELSEVTVRELLFYLKKLWEKIKNELQFYKYEF